MTIQILIRGGGWGKEGVGGRASIPKTKNNLTYQIN